MCCGILQVPSRHPGVVCVFITVGCVRFYSLHNFPQTIFWAIMCSFMSYNPSKFHFSANLQLLNIYTQGSVFFNKEISKNGISNVLLHLMKAALGPVRGNIYHKGFDFSFTPYAWIKPEFQHGSPSVPSAQSAPQPCTSSLDWLEHGLHLLLCLEVIKIEEY